MTHNLDNPKLYPMYHTWATNRNRLQVYSNVQINIGDTIKLPDGKTVTVKDYPFFDFSEETRMKAYVNREGLKEKGVYNVIPEYFETNKGTGIKGTDIYTRFYKLEIE